MMWIFLSLLGAFGQALSWALKKKVLESKGINNILGFVSYGVAGAFLFLFWGVSVDFVFPVITQRFVVATSVLVLLNILAIWTAYKALDKTALSKLMPLMALTSLGIVPIEYVLRGVIPTTGQLVGIVLVIVGGILFGLKEKIGKDALGAMKYFLVTLVCYSIASPFSGVMVDESGSGLFSASIAHLFIALGFIPIVWLSGEGNSVRLLKASGQWGKVVFSMALVGVVVGLLENGPINVALETAKASEVFALKRTMPFFALILGMMMFKEKMTRRHVYATTFLVVGSILVVALR